MLHGIVFGRGCLKDSSPKIPMLNKNLRVVFFMKFKHLVLLRRSYNNKGDFIWKWQGESNLTSGGGRS